MAIAAKGSGGSIKLTGTGGSLRFISSGGGGGGGGPTDPSLTNLIAWYRADDIALSNGAPVTGWDDRQGTSELTRVYNGPITYNSSNSSFNNQPTIDFGNGGLIDTWNTPSFNLGPRLAGNTIIMVVKPIYEGGSNNHLLWLPGGYGGDGQGYNIFANDMGGALGSAIRVVGYNGSGTILKTVEPNKTLIIYVSYQYGTTTTSNTLQIFGASSTFIPEWSWGGASLMSGGGNSGDGEMPIYGTPGRLTLGYTLGTSTAEVLYYNAVQGAQEKTDTIAYLASRYGISI